MKHCLFACGAGVLFHVAQNCITADKNTALIGLKFSRDDLEKGGLSGSVNADKADFVLIIHIKRNV